MPTEQSTNITENNSTNVIHVNFVTGQKSSPIDDAIVDSIRDTAIRLFRLSEAGAILDSEDETNALIALKYLSSNELSEQDLRKSLTILANDYVKLLSAKIRNKVATVECQVRPNDGEDYAVTLRLAKENDRFVLAVVPRAKTLSDES
ncbi:MAG: hypothetical protein JSS75_06045 [Bacteroidetes bacterium]|nr:hypothetical protein [Bacteroidota bacterium]